MTVVEQPKRGGLVGRVQGILLRPKTEWDVIDVEPATVQGLYTGYACILAAIPAIAGFIGMQVFGIGAFGVTYRPPLVGGLVQAVVGYILSLVMVFILALVIDGLAPTFGSQKNQIQALKLAVYASTAGWVAGIFTIIPMLSILAALGGLYGLYILYLGLPKLMKTPQDKVLGYFVVSILVAIVLFVVVAIATSAVRTMGLMGAPAAGGVVTSQGGGTLRVGNSSVDLGKLQASTAAAAAVAAASANAMQAGKTVDGKTVAAVDPEKLKAFLPASVAGLPRTELTSQTAGAAGMSGSNAEAVYSKDSARITLTVTDLAAAGAFAAMASAMGVQSTRETATGYSKVGKVGGRMTTEEWDTQSKSGKFGVLVADRFMVEADGSAASINDLKSAVAAVGPDRLEGLAKG
jgi:hypothetical protein